MGFFYKYIIQPLIAKSIGKKAFTNNPYLGLVIDAPESDVIADELFRVGMAYYEGAYMLPKDMDKAISKKQQKEDMPLLKPLWLWGV